MRASHGSRMKNRLLSTPDSPLKDRAARAPRWAARLAFGASLLAGIIGVALILKKSDRSSQDDPRARATAAPLQVDEAAARPPPTTLSATSLKPPDSGPGPANLSERTDPDAMAPALSWAEMHATWETEPKNPDWTENMVSYLTSVMYVVDAAPTMLEQVDCRQSICRVVLREEDFATMFRLSQVATTDEYRFGYL